MKEKDVFELIKFSIEFDDDEKQITGYRQVNVPDSYLSFNKIENNSVIISSNLINSPKFIQSEFLAITHNINIHPYIDNTYFDGNLAYNRYKNDEFVLSKFKINNDRFSTGKFPITYDWKNKFSIGEIDVERKLHIKLNYKFDFSGSKRITRTYFEEEYFLSYLGKFSSFISNSDKKTEFLHIINKSVFKVVDLRKIL